MRALLGVPKVVDLRVESDGSWVGRPRAILGTPPQKTLGFAGSLSLLDGSLQSEMRRKREKPRARTPNTHAGQGKYNL